MTLTIEALVGVGLTALSGLGIALYYGRGMLKNFRSAASPDKRSNAFSHISLLTEYFRENDSEEGVQAMNKAYEIHAGLGRNASDEKPDS